MNQKQIAAVENLRKALEKCHSVGLEGGVYEYSFRVWPSNLKPKPQDTGKRFFETVEIYGASIRSPMLLDGGAGV